MYTIDNLRFNAVHNTTQTHTHTHRRRRSRETNIDRI